MTVKLIYVVVYDTVELLEENTSTYSEPVGLLYQDMVNQGKITDYCYTVDVNTLTRINTITYADMAARNEHKHRYQAIPNANDVAPGRRVVSSYLEDSDGIRTLIA